MPMLVGTFSLGFSVLFLFAFYRKFKKYFYFAFFRMIKMSLNFLGDTIF